MSIPQVRPPIIRDVDDLFQRDARTSIKTLDTAGLRRSTVKGVALGTATVKVPHQLGKIPVGWTIIDKTAQGDVWRDTTVATTQDFLALKASASVTVDLQFW